VELPGGHADGGAHGVLQLAAATPHHAAGIGGLVDLVLDGLAGDPVTPALAVHALDPEVVGLHRVAVAVDHEELRVTGHHNPL
jgi:hypothetical protein